MGALASAVQNGPQVKKGPPCTVGLWLETLDPETRDEANVLMASDVWQHTELVKAFKPLGCDALPQTIARHRKGECKHCG